MLAARPRAVRPELQGRGVLVQQHHGVVELAVPVTLAAATVAVAAAAGPLAAAAGPLASSLAAADSRIAVPSDRDRHSGPTCQ